MFHLHLKAYTKPIELIFTKLDGKVAHGPWKKRLDFSGNPHLDPGALSGITVS